MSDDSEPMPSALLHTDQEAPVAAGDVADVPLPTARGCPFDPPGEYQRLRDEGPLSRLALPDGGHGWLLSGYDEVRSLLADPRTSAMRGFWLNPIQQPPEARWLPRPRPGQFLRMDPPEHTRYRRLLTGQFTVRRMNALTPRIEQIVADHLDAMGDMARPVDLVENFALPVPSLVICELLDVPYADRERFQQLSRVLLSMTTDVRTLVQVRYDLYDYMLGLVRAKRLQPGDDLLSGLIAREDDPEGALSDEELVHIGNLLLLAGHETTANMLALGTLALLEHPTQLAALRADPSLIDQAVEELLRYLTIVQFGLMRDAAEDLEVGGQCIRAGEPVVASLAAANRDPQQFPDPDVLDLSRQYSPHLAFGHGIHQCLGQQLARIELRVGFTALLKRFPSLRLAVPLDQIRMRDETFIYGVHELLVTWDGDERWVAGSAP